jgi:hypothetical protein
MKGDMRKNSGIRIKELRDNRKNKSIFETLPHYPFEGFNCFGGSFVILETATGTIKASFP